MRHAGFWMLAGLAMMLAAGCARQEAPQESTGQRDEIEADAASPRERQRTRIVRQESDTPAPAAPVNAAAADPATTATAAGTAPTTAAAAGLAPAPVPADDPATTPGETLQRISSAISAIDPITQPRLSPEAEQALQADLRKLITDAEKPGAFPKDTREGITLYADKMQFQLEEARKTGNSDAYIRHLARCRSLLQELEPLLEQK